MTRTYPHHGTCDGCAEGPLPLREVDPTTEAWICERCDERMDAGFAAAAEVMGVPVEVATAGIAVYFDAQDDPE